MDANEYCDARIGAAVDELLAAGFNRRAIICALRRHVDDLGHILCSDGEFKRAAEANLQEPARIGHAQFGDAD